jgi:uncharacterized protein (UPF0264 family)
MLDTAETRAGRPVDARGREGLQGFVFATRKAGVLVGLAGALRAKHADALAELAPDFAGFRSAVCRGERSDALDAQCLQDLVLSMRFARAPLTPR